MTREPFAPAWRGSAGQVDAARLWAASGGQWLTDAGVAVPGRLMAEVADLAAYLDAVGADLADELPARGVGILGERAALQGLGPSGSITAGGAGRLLRCADGWIALSLARTGDRELVPAWLESEGPDAVGPGWSSIASWVARRDAAYLRERASLLGLACSAVGEVTDRAPVLVEHIGGAAVRPIAGTSVVNLASLWAGPLAADVLARAGADVLSVESTTRPDGARGPGEFFAALHSRCRLVALPLATEDGRRQLRALLERADIVIEGSRPRALRQMGIEARELVASGPQLWVSITSHGRTAPDDLRVGFGDDAAAAGGLVGWVDGAPRFVADAVADPLTGLTVAAVVTQLLTAGARALVDVALARVAAGAAVGDASRGSRPLPAPSPPVGRRVSGPPPVLGRDTAEVLRSLGIR